MLKFPHWLFISILLLLDAPVQAQIVPDSTLGEQRSRLTPNVLPSLDLIDGGAQRGSNLFHSFSEFNVNSGRGVYFANPLSVQNILTRVTGSTASNIQGLLGVAGNANLFLLNPNGIIFGANAQLDVRGSFVGSTANAIQFGNQGIFSATNPAAPTLLTVQASAFLFTQLQPGRIQNQSQADAGTISSIIPVSGLRVGDGQSLVLLGGDIDLDNGALVASGGRVELGGLSAPGEVKLAIEGSNFRLAFPDNVSRADVSIANGSSVRVEAETGGSIAINAQSVTLQNQSTVTNGTISSSQSSTNTAGDIAMNATGSLSLRDNSLIQNSALFSGNGGNIFITSDSLTLTNNSAISTTSFLSPGNAGNIVLSTKNDTTLTENSFLISSVVFGEGKAGDITLNTGSLLLTNASILGSAPFVLGGSSGSVTINARDRIVLGGEQPNDGSSINSFLFASEGVNGNIELNTGSLLVRNGASIFASTLGKNNAGDITINARDAVVFDGNSTLTFASTGTLPTAEGNAGNITIKAGSVSIRNGAVLSSRTDGKGNAGNITINARDSVLFEDAVERETVSSAAGLESEGNGGNLTINAGSVSVIDGAVLSAVSAGTGNSGDITIDVRDRLSMANNSNISSLTFGSGNAGKVTIQAGDAVTLDNGSAISTVSFSFRDIALVAQNQGISDVASLFEGITADQLEALLERLPQTVGDANDIEISAGSLRLNQSGLITASGSGNGGNIRLQLRDVLLLRQGSQIATSAGVFERGGNGGNITIDSPLIAAVPGERSQIAADAFMGRGGNVSIRTSGLFGIVPRSTPPNFLNNLPIDQSQITASSQLGVQGDITITQPDVQPTQGTIELPVNLIDASNQIAQVCRRGTVGESAGRFVVSGRGSVPPSPIDPLSDVGILNSLATSEVSTVPSATATIAPPEIIEAQGWTRNLDGAVKLVAQEPNSNSMKSIAGCISEQQN